MTRKTMVVVKRVLHYSFLAAVCSLLSYSTVRGALSRRREPEVPPPGKVVVVERVYRTGYHGPARVNGQVVMLELPGTFVLVIRGYLDDGTVADCEHAVPQELWNDAEVGDVIDLAGGEPGEGE